MLRYLWPRSLKGQVLLSLGLALMLGQAISAALLYRAQHDRRESALVQTAAVRLAAALRAPRSEAAEGRDSGLGNGPFRSPRVEIDQAAPVRKGEHRDRRGEAELTEILTNQDIPFADLMVLRRSVSADPVAQRRLARRNAVRQNALQADEVLIAAIRQKDAAGWIVARVLIPPTERLMVQTLIAQTLLIYAVILGAMALILGRITRPLAALTRRLERFADTRNADGQITPEGPDDVRRLMAAHNAMEGRIAALLDEKDVMLGAIGHDLKTPLAALRVRIESVEDETERKRMAATIEDITRSLDDILSLARVGRPSDPAEPTELAALVAAVVEEYEDMGEPVVLLASARTVLSLRQTWLRRALRNLIGNALRYGSQARVTLVRDGSAVTICIADDGPGIAADQIARMMEPFTRGEPSRNSGTGGAGLGLTLAKAIAEQHGGTLTLTNRTGADGGVSGLDAVLRLPLG